MRERRSSAPTPSSSSCLDHGEMGRKWSGGLMPLPSAGCYGKIPEPTPVRQAPKLSVPNLKQKKIKTYSAYSVSKYVNKRRDIS